MTASDVAAAIETLPRRERIAFVLHDVLGGTHADVAAILEVSSARAFQLREMALRRLRTTLVRRDHEWRYPCSRR